MEYFRGQQDAMHKIAIIEDTQDNRDLLFYLLRDDYDVARYDSGESALAGFATTVPDLIVLDIWLQGMDGVEVLKRIRQDPRLRKVPVIALTANAMMGDREKYMDDGFDEYVSKPIIDIRAFLETIRGLL